MTAIYTENLTSSHFPPAPAGAINREPRATSDAEAAFLTLGDGAALWLKEAAAQGSSRIRVKMAHAVAIAKLTNPARVDWALGHAAVHQRFGEGDLASILAANLDPTRPAARQAGEDKSLTQGTAGWAALGAAPTDSRVDSHRHNNSHEYPEHDGHNNSHPVEDNR